MLSRSTAPLLALVLAVPVLGVLLSLFNHDAGAWAHIIATILPGLVVSSLSLVVIVGLGVVIIGTVTVWLTAHHEFPSRAWLEWALILPLATPVYVMA